MKKAVIYIILMLFLGATLIFWMQIMRIKDLPPSKRPSPPVVTPEEAEAFIKLAQELLIDYREPLPNLYGRDPFYKEEPTDLISKEFDPSERLTLSSIVYTQSNSFAVVNGNIMSEGDTIYDEEFGAGFMIEDIGIDQVEINDGEKKYTLRKIRDAKQ